MISIYRRNNNKLNIFASGRVINSIRLYEYIFKKRVKRETVIVLLSQRISMKTVHAITGNKSSFIHKTV